MNERTCEVFTARVPQRLWGGRDESVIASEVNTFLKKMGVAYPLLSSEAILSSISQRGAARDVWQAIAWLQSTYPECRTDESLSHTSTTKSTIEIRAVQLTSIDGTTRSSLANSLWPSIDLSKHSTSITMEMVLNRILSLPRWLQAIVCKDIVVCSTRVRQELRLKGQLDESALTFIGSPYCTISSCTDIDDCGAYRWVELRRFRLVVHIINLPFSYADLVLG